MDSLIDLRSDTVTRPTPAMREAMACAEVGDDVYGEDPTVNRLEERAAECVGKEAAVFVPTGTMGNVLGVKVNTRHGDELLCDSRSHIIDWELSMVAWFAGCQARMLPTPDGVLRWEQVRQNVKKGGSYTAATTLLLIENTHNMSGGTVYPLPVLDELTSEARAAGLRIHIDGARIFNAAVACGESSARLARGADTIMFCLSKGLGAPAGSLLAGSEEDMAQARIHRKRLGGGMRQIGVLAAAGLIALEEMPKRLAEDHANARLLAERLAAIPGLTIDPLQVTTNILICSVAECGLSAWQFSAELKQRQVLANAIDDKRIRFVTHLDVSREQCEQAAEIARDVASLKCAAGR